jgi:DnaJ-class molecular chaperone
LEVDYYYLLGVSENAPTKEIKLAYRRMAEIYHPDKLGQLPDSEREEGEEIMRLLNEAKSILLDPERRQRYDERIGAGLEFEEAYVMAAPPSTSSSGYRVAIEKESLGNKMSRVLGSMKDVFRKDKDFQSKIAIAEEIFEAQEIDGNERETEDVMVLDEEEEEDEEVEMKLEFMVVDKKRPDMKEPDIKSKERRFKILAIEADDGDQVSEDDEVEVEWE